ncbi:hypothetical protein F5Y05DRAFT_410198 [Hypoxylon sp. FL0543]|nr:hypothetical protein F5Y05DRAFT_410198 [Hypoxylon sp. FL0543]
MLITKIFALAATAAASTPRDPLSASSAEYSWQITAWQAGQSHGNPAEPTTGWYNFFVSGDEVDEESTSIPKFSVQCQGYADGWPLRSNLTACGSQTALTDASVAARVLPSDTQAHIAVYYIFSTDGVTTRNFTTTIVEDWARERPPHNFTTTPTEAAYIG